MEDTIAITLGSIIMLFQAAWRLVNQLLDFIFPVVEILTPFVAFGALGLCISLARQNRALRGTLYNKHVIKSEDYIEEWSKISWRDL